MVIELLGKLQIFDEYGELETVKLGDWAEASERAAVGASDVGVVLIGSCLVVFFMFTVEHGLVCCF